MKWKDLPTLGYTHFQPAQLTTVGKRATLWAQDLAIDLEEIEHRIATLQFPRRQGDDRHAGVVPLPIRRRSRQGRAARPHGDASGSASRESFAVTGQTYPRKVDAQVVSALAGVAASVHKFCNDIRLLAGMKQIEEPFEEEQVGSSAMAYKRNPMRCERATGLARFVISLASSPRCRPRPSSGSSGRWTTRPTSGWPSPSRSWRSTGACRSSINVARGLVVYPKTIEAAVMAELPFMATEEILMAAVAAGGDRQELHERIRRHSQAAAEAVKTARPAERPDRPPATGHSLCQDRLGVG